LSWRFLVSDQKPSKTWAAWNKSTSALLTHLEANRYPRCQSSFIPFL
jgi:hypothetical protein